jgi:hypothetical protein
VPSQTVSREQLLDRYVYLAAIAEVIETLTDPRSPLLTIDGPPLEGLPGEFAGEEWDCSAALFYGRLAEEVGEALFPMDDPARDGEDDDAYTVAYRRSQVLAARMLCRLAGASEFCARAADRKLSLAAEWAADG